MSRRIGQPLDMLQCNGCRSDKRSYYCENNCKMYKCAAEKGIDFCGECDERRLPEGSLLGLVLAGF